MNGQMRYDDSKCYLKDASIYDVYESCMALLA